MTARVASLMAIALTSLACGEGRLLTQPAREPLLMMAGGHRTDPVISQVYGGGGNAGATLRNDFVELFNPGSQAVDLSGWTVQYASATGSTWQVTALSGLVQPGAYFLVQQAAGSGGSTSLPAADVVGGIPMAATAGKVWLVRGATALTGTCPAEASIVDRVSYGPTSSDCGLGTTAVLSNTAAALRAGNGCVDTGVLSADFIVGPPAPRNSGSATIACDDTPDPPAPPTGPSSAIVITEVMANPSAVPDSLGEWFEVHNRGSADVDLRGWTIASAGDAPQAIAASVPLPAGAYVVLARQADPDENGGVSAAHAYGVVNFSNTSDWLSLQDRSGETMDSVTWGPPPAGASRVLLSPSSDNTNVDGAAWTTSTITFGVGDRGTPGRSNSGPPPPRGELATLSISINTPAEVPAGYTKPAFATARDAYGTILSPPPAYAWTSSDPGVASVDALGYITGVAPGAVIITVAAPNGASARANFLVAPGDAPTPAAYRDHLEFGTPADATSGDDHVIRRRQFALSYSAARGGPSWVSWNLNATHFGDEDRCNCFTPDPSLPGGFYRVVDYDYRNGGYDRGHMVQSFTRTTTGQENATTFLLTNILPQAAENNQGPWAALENHTNDVVRRQGKDAFVIAGGEYSANPQTLKGEGKVQIPEFTWKVVVFVDAGKGADDVRTPSNLEVIAVRMPNDTIGARGIRNTSWENFRTTVDEIERRVGYDLLAELPDWLEAVVESGARPRTARPRSR